MGIGTSASGYRDIRQWVPGHPPVGTGTSASGYRDIRQWVPGHRPVGIGTSASGYRDIRQWVPGHPLVATGTSASGYRDIRHWLPGHPPLGTGTFAGVTLPWSSRGSAPAPSMERLECLRFLQLHLRLYGGMIHGRFCPFFFYIECTHHTVSASCIHCGQ